MGKMRDREMEKMTCTHFLAQIFGHMDGSRDRGSWKSMEVPFSRPSVWPSDSRSTIPRLY